MRRIEISEQELATVLAALRYWQKHGIGVWEHPDFAEYFIDAEPLDRPELDELCERINCTPVDAPGEEPCPIHRAPSDRCGCNIEPLFPRVARAAHEAAGIDPQSTEPTVWYIGHRQGHGATVTVHTSGQSQIQSLPTGLHLVNHSPDGFEWGYGGSGPAQLAFALCYHATGDEQRARRVYQGFKGREIEPLARDGTGRDLWRMTRARVLATIETLEQEAAACRTN